MLYRQQWTVATFFPFNIKKLEYKLGGLSEKLFKTNYGGEPNVLGVERHYPECSYELTHNTGENSIGSQSGTAVGKIGLDPDLIFY